MRKPRSDSKLLNLPEEQQIQLAEWLLSGMPSHVAQTRVKEEFKVSVSLGAFSSFWEEVCGPVLIARRSKVAKLASTMSQEIGQTEQLDQATVDALRQKAFEIMISPSAKPKDIESIFSLVLQSEKHLLEKSTLKLAREKFEFDAARKCLAKLPELEAVSKRTGIDDQARLDEARRVLFGVTPN